VVNPRRDLPGQQVIHIGPRIPGRRGPLPLIPRPFETPQHLLLGPGQFRVGVPEALHPLDLGKRGGEPFDHAAIPDAHPDHLHIGAPDKVAPADAGSDEGRFRLLGQLEETEVQEGIVDALQEPVPEVPHRHGSRRGSLLVNGDL